MDTTRPSTCPFARSSDAIPADTTVQQDASPRPSSSVPNQDPPATDRPALNPPGCWPPGPPAPINGWGLLRQMSRDLPGTLARWVREYGDLVHLKIWPEHEVIVTDPTLIRQLLVDHHDDLVRWRRAMQVFGAAHGHSVLVVEGEPWRSKRRALQPAFAPQPVQAFVPTIADACAAALARWPARSGHWPIEQALTELTMDVILKMMFSSPLDDEGSAASTAVRDVSEALNAEFFWPVSLPDWVPWKRRKRRGIATLDRLIQGFIQQRLNRPEGQWPDDLLTRLLKLHLEDPARWPLDAVHDECRTAFLAGHETTAAALTWWAWCMASHPEAQARAAAECAALNRAAPSAADLRRLPWLGQTLQESMRLYPSAPMLFTRRALRPITLGSWQFPARTLFLLPLGLVQRDPRWFPDPDQFQPERFAPERADRETGSVQRAPRGSSLPFGAGPRVCLGQHLATAEMTMVAVMLLQRFRLIRPADLPAPVPRLQITMRPATPLVLAIERVD